MACNFPLKAFWTGNRTDAGKKELFISKQEGMLISVADVEKAGYKVTSSADLVPVNGVLFLRNPVLIPCGHCSGCRLASSKEWTTRGVLESKMHSYNYFLTLTYSDDCLPVSGLDKKDLQDFFKRFRYHLENAGLSNFKYLACGEYGDITFRPHYHMILFCDDPLPLIRIGPNRHHCPLVADSWKFGLHEVSFSNSSTIAYVCGYVNKKIGDAKDYGSLTPPFRLASRSPAIGRSWLESHGIDDSFKVYGPFGKNKSSASVPRYFRNLLGDKYDVIKPGLLEDAQRISDLTDSVAGSSNMTSKGCFFEDIQSSLINERKKI